MADKIVVLSFGLGGFSGHMPTEHYGNGASSKGTLSGYDTDPERTVKDLTSSPKRKAQNATYDCDGAVVIDKRAALDGANGVSLCFKAPLLDLDLEGSEPFDALDVVKNTIVGQALLGEPRNAYGQLLAGAAIGAVNLGSCGIRDYVAYWRKAGARIGIVRDGDIVWD